MTDDESIADLARKIPQHAARVAEMLKRSPDLRAQVFHPEGYDVSFEGRGPRLTQYPIVDDTHEGQTLLGLRRAVLVDEGEDGEGRLLNKATIGVVISEVDEDPEQTYWSVWARGMYSWTTPGVNKLLDAALTSMDALTDITGRFPVGRLICLGPGLERSAIRDLLFLRRREIVVLAHAPNARRLAHFEKVLPTLADNTRSSCIFVLYNDPRGVSRRRYIEKGRSIVSGDSYVRNAFPEPGGVIAWLPPTLNTLKPKMLTDIPRELSAAEADDQQGLAAWIAKLLLCTWTAPWPRMTFLPPDAETKIRDYLPSVANPDLVEQLTQVVWGQSKKLELVQQQRDVTIVAMSTLKDVYDRCQGELTETRDAAVREHGELLELRRRCSQQRGQLDDLEKLVADFEARMAAAHVYDLETLIAQNKLLQSEQEVALNCAAEAEEKLEEAQRKLRKRYSHQGAGVG